MSVTSGISNTGIGSNSGSVITVGQDNTFLGAAANAAANNLNNVTAIGVGAVAVASNNMRLGNSQVDTIIGTVDWTFDSDRRLKQDIEDTDLGLTFILDLRPRTYRMKANPKKKHIGLISQEVKETMDKQGVKFGGYHPPAVPNSNYSFAGLQSGAFVMPLINAVKELTKRLEALEKENEKLKINWSKIKDFDSGPHYSVHDIPAYRH